MQYREENNRISNVIETTLKNINGLIDVNTVVGKPIKTEYGDYIIPVSKVTVGMLVGGGEYGKINIFKKAEDLPYSAGNGAVISVKPCGFLIKEGDKYKVLSVSNSSYDKIIEKASDLIAEMKNEN